MLSKYFPLKTKNTIINALFIGFLGVVLFGAGTVLADSTCTTVFCGGGLRQGLDATKTQLKGNGISTSDSIINVILGLIEFSLPFAGLAAFVGLIYGGFLYVTSFASDQSKKAQEIIMYSVFGILMIYIAYPLVSTLIKFRS